MILNVAQYQQKQQLKRMQQYEEERCQSRERRLANQRNARQQLLRRRTENERSSRRREQWRREQMTAFDREIARRRHEVLQKQIQADRTARYSVSEEQDESDEDEEDRRRMEVVPYEKTKQVI